MRITPRRLVAAAQSSAARPQSLSSAVLEGRPWGDPVSSSVARASVHHVWKSSNASPSKWAVLGGAAAAAMQVGPGLGTSMPMALNRSAFGPVSSRP
eukprot:6660147-Pyramimonas_sp.AAC.1